MTLLAAQDPSASGTTTDNRGFIFPEFRRPDFLLLLYGPIEQLEMRHLSFIGERRRIGQCVPASSAPLQDGLPAFNQSLLLRDWSIPHGRTGGIQNADDAQILSSCRQILHESAEFTEMTSSSGGSYA